MKSFMRACMIQEMDRNIARTTLSVLLATTALSAVYVAPVQAQEAAGIDEVVVTARKRAESIQDVPVAVTALSQDIVEGGNLDELSEFVDLVPNATFTNESDTSSEISIRGSGRNISDEDPSVGLYRDGVYVGGLLFSTANFYDTERVEVLRGPQAGLYGRNAVGGALNVISAKPTFDFEGYGQLQIATKDRIETRAAINIPLVEDILAVRASGLLVDQNEGFDYIVNQDLYTDAIDNRSGRLRALFTPTGELEFLFTAEYLKVDGGAPLTVPAPEAATGFLDQDRTFAIPGTSADDTDNQFRDFEQQRDFEQSQLAGEMNWDLGLGTLTAIASIRNADFDSKRDEDLSNFDVSAIQYFAEQESFFSEVRFTSDEINGFRFLTGLNYMDEEVVLNFENRIGGALYGVGAGFGLGGLDVANLYATGVFDADWAALVNALAGTSFVAGDSIALLGLTPGATGWGGFLGDTFPTEYINEQSLESFAAYFEGTYSVSDMVEVWGNLRYTRDEKSINFAQTFGIPSQCPVACPEIFNVFFGIDPEVTAQTTETFENFSPGGGVNVFVNDSFLAYAKVVTGFKAGGFNSIASAVDLLGFDEEKTVGYEIGAKTDWFDKRLRVNVAAFLQDRKDALVTIADPNMPINSLGVNAGKMENKGIEIETSALLFDGLRIEVAAGYLDSTFKDFVVGGVDFSGNQVPRTFKYSLSSVISYERPVTSEFDAYGFALYRNAWDGFTDNDNIEKLSNPEIVDVRAGLRNDRWQLGFYVDNLFDNRYTVSEFRSIYDNGRHFGTFAAGRTMGLQGKWEF